MRGTKRLVATAMVFGAALVLAGCVPNSPVLGLTVIHGKTAIVVSLCPGERVTEVSTFHGDQNDNGITTTWTITAHPPQPGALFIVGMPRAKFITKDPLASTPLHQDEMAMVTVDSSYWHGEYSAFASDEFGRARHGSVLVNGSYISYGSYMADYKLCKQKEKNTSSKAFWQ